MSYGFFARGTNDHLIIDAENPVMRLVHKGRITVTSLHPFSGAVSSVHAHAWGYCTVMYPQVYRHSTPPMVFGAPNGGMANDVSVGLFSHLGSAGAWTGFRMYFMGALGRKNSRGVVYDYGNSKKVVVGMDTGWSYYVCTAEPGGPSNDSHGLRLFSEAGQVVFDSGWNIVPFRSLLTNWHAIGWPGSAYSGGSYLPIWPNLHSNHSGLYAWDDVDEYYAHSWGAADGKLGILLSSLGGMSQWVDYGSHKKTYVVPFIGFRGADRSRIICWIDFGSPQHKSATGGQALNGWGLLTADLSWT